jgi:biopolymer transport protein ExbB
MIDYFIKGGILMYPLLACSLLALAVMIERGIVYFRNRQKPWDAGMPAGGEEREFFHAVLGNRKKIQGSVCLVLRNVFANRGLAAKDMESQISLEGSLELRRLARYLHVLELVGRIAPLLGLFGTVLGLTGTFQSIAGLKQAVNPSMLAAGIWEALITTVAGLFVGIPALIAHHFYENLVRDTAFGMKMHAEKGIACLDGEAGP